MSVEPSSSIPLWGQAWELTVKYAAAGGTTKSVVVSASAWAPEALRITFDIMQSMNTNALWYADIRIYNANERTIQNALYNAQYVTLKAGFQTGPSRMGVVWAGPVFQTIFTKDEVVDQVLTLHCVAYPALLNNIVAFPVGPGTSQAQLAVRMTKEINMPAVSTSQGTLSKAAYDRMDAVRYPRGNTVFGKVSKFLSDIADSGFMQNWCDGQQTYISEVGSDKIETNLIYSPPFPPGAAVAQQAPLPTGTTTSLIGTPQQIQQGVIFTVLLDPRLKVGLPPLITQLVRTNIDFLLRTPFPDSDFPTMLQSDLKFFVTQVRHTGDSRGNEWRTEVTGWSIAYAQGLFNSIGLG